MATQEKRIGISIATLGALAAGGLITGVVGVGVASAAPGSLEAATGHRVAA
ncbi:MAG: hypothetical protein H0V22_10180, partial [Solirubrobacterales bacterium]|nr:hypothetical protein [Solirubrobacterales bacterium]